MRFVSFYNDTFFCIAFSCSAPFAATRSTSRQSNTKRILRRPMITDSPLPLAIADTFFTWIAFSDGSRHDPSVPCVTRSGTLPRCVHDDALGQIGFLIFGCRSNWVYTLGCYGLIFAPVPYMLLSLELSLSYSISTLSRSSAFQDTDSWESKNHTTTNNNNKSTGLFPTGRHGISFPCVPTLRSAGTGGIVIFADALLAMGLAV